MTKARHKRAEAAPRKRRVLTLALTAAVMVSLPAGVAAWPGNDPPDPEPVVALGEIERPLTLSRGLGERPPVPSQSTPPTATPTASEPPTPEPPTPRPTAARPPEPTVVGHMYATTALNVRTGPGEDAEVLTVLARGTEVGVTGTSDGSWTQVIHDDELSWVSGDYLSETEPAEESVEPDDGISLAECESGSAVEAGLTPDAIRVHRAVCAQFPEVSSYGGVRPGGTHGQGRALDIMVSSGSLGDAIAEWVRDRYDTLGVSEVIWAQRIWTVERSSDGWRWMEDRGSSTANHYDHLHITVYGNAGG